LAFSVPNSQSAATLQKALRQAGGLELVDLELFDVYRGAGLADNTRGLTFRLCLQAVDRTLTDVEVTTIRQRCLDAAAKLGAHLRN
jgi:phenylalanyl-tRNA synthetase beta chain